MPVCVRRILQDNHWREYGLAQFVFFLLYPTAIATLYCCAPNALFVVLLLFVLMCQQQPNQSSKPRFLSCSPPLKRIQLSPSTSSVTFTTWQHSHSGSPQTLGLWGFFPFFFSFPFFSIAAPTPQRLSFSSILVPKS